MRHFLFKKKSGGEGFVSFASSFVVLQGFYYSTYSTIKSNII